MDGIINVLKPQGMTSHDVVSFIRRTLKIKRVGHTGTLDPGVVGVLPICLGKATRIAQFLTDMDKVYAGELTLGFTTDTQDGFGQFLSEQDGSTLVEQEIRGAFSSFLGPIEQVPPMVSAVKHNGKRLYELARAGIEVERKPRKITIHNLAIKTIEDLATAHPRVSFEVRCSKGTYVRTLCHDLGQRLGVGGYMSHLVRTASGPFTLKTAHDLEAITEAVKAGELSAILLPIEAGLGHLEVVEVRESAEKAVGHGNTIYEPGITSKPEQVIDGQLVRLHNQEGRLLAVAKIVTACPEQEDRSKVYFQPVTVFV